MARRSQRLSLINAPGKKHKHKRAASGEIVANIQPKRPKQQNTPLAAAHPAESDNASEGAESMSNLEESASDFEDQVRDTTPAATDEEEESHVSSESEDVTPKKKTIPGGEIWRPGVKTGLGPGKQVIIKKPKARKAGNTPYAEKTIHPNTLLFLADLKENNDRQWLKMHDADFRQSEKDWLSFVEKMTERLTEIDDTVPELPVKDVVFRIYRDIRFSKDPTPYKAWFSVAWSRAGRKSSAYAHYYLQIGGDKSFIGGGLWQPEASPMAAMRREIDQNSSRLKRVLVDEKIRKEFLGNCGKSEAAVVKAFVSSNSQNALKTRPKGFPVDHPDIEILRLRNYTIGRTLSRDEVLGETGASRIAELLAYLKPYITYLNSVIAPDQESERSDPEEDEQDNESGASSSGGGS